MLVVGQREEDDGTVSIRLRDGRQLPPMKIDEFTEYALEKIKSRSLEL
jgi:threonyl-tRNA synthetase